MKVTTEGCILGAFATANSPRRILDIGAGTGLLALMLRQRYDCEVTALELNRSAYEQCQRNFSNSPWSDQLTAIHTDANEFVRSTKHVYDLIISNPPFFARSLKSERHDKNLARHEVSLSKSGLAYLLVNLLSNSGVAYVLYPEIEADQFSVECQKSGMAINDVLIIRNYAQGPVFRKILKVSKNRSMDVIEKSELHIRQSNQDYTSDFIQLMKPYYLYL